ncbi:MAG TPA: ABC transporter permease [Steroidobacteraceae bacterium]
MSRFKQIGALLQMSVRGIPQRLVASLATAAGIACVVGVLVAMLSMGAGARRMAMQNVRADRAMVTTKGSQSVFVSGLSAQAVATIEDEPGIKRDADGKPLAAAYTLTQVDLYKKSNHVRSSSLLYGVSPRYFEVNPDVRIMAGRAFRPGLHELIAGKSRYEQFEGLEIGDKIRARGVDWTVVGRFTENGGSLENALLGDADTVTSAFGRNNMQVVIAVLESAAQFDAFAATLKSDPAIDVDAKHEAEWAAAGAKGLTGILNFISYFVGTVMALGASLGALNVMYSIVDGRKRELATLRAIGFGGGPIMVSVLLESLLLALPGALLGALLAWAWFNGSSVSPVGTSIKLVVTPALVAIGTLWALAIGLVGGFLPALRAARLPVATALRAT